MKKITGAIRVTQRGKGFVENGKETVEIAQEWLGTALPGDTVEVEIVGKNQQQSHGKVIKVVARARTRFVGTILKTPEGTRIVADDRRIYVPFVISKEARPPSGGLASPSSKILVELVEWKDAKSLPTVRFIKELGKAGEHETEIAAILYGNGFDYDFPPEAEDEAKTAEQSFLQTVTLELKKRKDFREVPTFTIDPENAKDFDDALSVEKIGNGKWKIGVHIADVSFFVRRGTALERLARERATSVYMVDRTIPMLPEALSANICSLRPNKERLVYSAVFEMTDNGKITSEWFGRGIVCSAKRFTYKEAQEVLDTKNGLMKEELERICAISRVLKKERVAKGSILFDKEEVQVVLDEHNEPKDIFSKPHYETQNVIEEWMLLANRRVAEFMSRAISARKFPGFVFRIHDRPDRERIDALAIFLKGIGHELKSQKGNVSGADLNRLFRAIEGAETEGLIKQAALRSMAKAIYTTKNIGHFGLGFEHYTHFTSPIRRYPDILVHRLLDMYLAKHTLPPGAISEYEAVSVHSSQKEREAEIAERDSVKWMQAKYMARHLGDVFTGVITGVTDWGFYVEEEKTKSSGLVHVKTIGDDYYEFNEKKYEITGARSHKKFRLGDKVRIKVASADPDQKQINYELVK